MKRTKTNIAKLILTLAMVLALQTMVIAAEKSIAVAAKVPELSGIMEVTISAVDAKDATNADDDVWTPGQNSISFGTLTRDVKNKIFTASNYYAVDVAVLDNTGKGWTLTHTVMPVGLYRVSRSINLDESINVAFAKVMKPRGATKTTEVDLSKGNYLASNNVQFNRATLEGNKGGWLRIYYGIATGNKDGSGGLSVDPEGSFPIAQYQHAGTYVGRVTLTLAQQ